jgi:hypothetical protein
MKKLLLTFLTALGLAGLFGGCAEKTAHTKGVYMLLDTSGTYTEELVKAQQIINYILVNMNPGDTFAVARIDTGSFSEKDILAKVTFDDRPSVTNEQKRAFRATIDTFVKNVKSSPYTDVSGGLLQAVEFLSEAGPAQKTVLIFSDMQEDLKPGFKRNFPIQLEGFKVIATNVIKLYSDIKDPTEYMDRLKMWKQKVESGGGEWGVINDLERLDPIFGR